uniref:BTB domain-containing protein n=1 Tax=Haemonchus contortus TaxID=6289 RepID=A0A7I4YHI7_HAECO
MSTRVKLNVGGQLFETSLRTLEGASKLLELVKDAHRSHEVFAEEKQNDPIFIDRDPELFRVVLRYFRDGKISLTRNDSDIELIRDEAEFYGVESLVEKLRYEQAHRGPFFTGESVVWRDPDIRCLCADVGIHFDGSTEKIPLCLNAFREIKGMEEHNCPWCHIARKIEECSCIFDYPRHQTQCSGTIVKVYGDSCCYDVRFGNWPALFHVRGDMLRLANERHSGTP